MRVEFSIVPLGTVSSRVAEVLRFGDTSGLADKVTPMGTVVKGNRDEVFRLIKRCHKSALRQEELMQTDMRIDAKAHSAGEKLGKVLKK